MESYCVGKESHCDQIKAMLPSLINGKTHEQLEQEEGFDAINGLFHFVNGIKFPWIIPRSNLEALKTFEVRTDDVYICTYPRSGKRVVYFKECSSQLSKLRLVLMISWLSPAVSRSTVRLGMHSVLSIWLAGWLGG